MPTTKLSITMLASLQPCAYTCGKTLNKQNFINVHRRSSLSCKTQRQPVLAIVVGQDPAGTGCNSPGRSSPRLSLPSALGVLLASFLTANSIIPSPALAKAAPLKKSDPYEVLASCPFSSSLHVAWMSNLQPTISFSPAGLAEHH